MADAVHSTSPFIAKLLAPLAADEIPVADRAFCNELRKDIRDRCHSPFMLANARFELAKAAVDAMHARGSVALFSGTAGEAFDHSLLEERRAAARELIRLPLPHKQYLTYKRTAFRVLFDEADKKECRAIIAMEAAARDALGAMILRTAADAGAE